MKKNTNSIQGSLYLKIQILGKHFGEKNCRYIKIYIRVSNIISDFRSLCDDLFNYIERICLFIISGTLVHTDSLSLLLSTLAPSLVLPLKMEVEQIVLARETIPTLDSDEHSPVGQIIGLDVLRPGELAEYDLILSLDYLLFIDIVLPQQTQRIRHDCELMYPATLRAHAQNGVSNVKARSHDERPQRYRAVTFYVCVSERRSHFGSYDRRYARIDVPS